MKNVLLFLCQGFEELEAAAFTDVLGWSRDLGLEPVNVTTVALRKEIKCTWNLIVKPQIRFKEININNFDALAIPGGFEEAGFYKDAYNPDFLNLIRQFNEKKKIIASICVGALPIGKSGILEGRKATTYHLNKGVRQQQLADFGAIISTKHIAIDKNIITSSSPSTAIDVAFKLLEMLTSKVNVQLVKENMGFIR